MNKKQVIRLTESQFHQIVKESVKRIVSEGVYDFASDKPQFDINSDEFKTHYDAMSDDYYDSIRKQDNDLTNLQIAHYNGAKGKQGYDLNFDKSKRKMPKSKPISVETIRTNVLNALKNKTPYEDIPNFEPLSPEEAQYYSDRYLLSNTIQPIGTILKGTFLVIHDLKNNTFKVSTEPIEY